MPSVQYPRIFKVSPTRLYALVWAAVFFVMINMAVFFLFHDRGTFQRFPYHTSYQDIRTVIDTIRHDPRRKIVFLGGSVLWGASSKDPQQTIPAAFARHLPPDVAVYNLGVIAGRPIDSFVMALLLRSSADLFIEDYNYEFGFTVDQDRLLQDSSTYVREDELYNTNADLLYGQVPALKQCMLRFGLSLPRTYSVGESAIRHFYEEYVPIVRYKDRINDALFGQHPALLIQQIGEHLTDILSGHMKVSDLFQPPEEQINEKAWTDPHTAGMEQYRKDFQARVFSGQELLDCLSSAFASYAHQTHLPLVTYITPDNPVMFPAFSSSPVHARNIGLLLQDFSGTLVYNLDTQKLQEGDFADSTHLTPAGNDHFGDLLFQTLRPVLQGKGLLSQ